MKRALQPVLVSAELWGRNFYSGEKLPTRICVINDKEDGSNLDKSMLSWQLLGAGGFIIASGNEAVPAVKHYSREWLTPEITIPATLPSAKTEARLVLKLTQNDNVISENEYKILLANKAWAQPALIQNKKIVLVDFNNMKTSFDYLKVNYTQAVSVTEALKTKGDVYVFSGLNLLSNCTAEELRQVRSMIAQGGKVLWLDSEKALKEMYPEYIKDWIVPTEGDIVNMEIPESSVFNGISPLEVRYFNNNKREIPTVCHVALKINRNSNVEGLASQTKIHGYINGEMDQRSAYMQGIKGFPIVKITDKGTLLISTMSLEKANTDPIAAKLLSNMVDVLIK